MTARVRGPAQEKKAGEILTIAFDGPAQNPRAVNFRGHRGGDGGSVSASLFHNHLDASGCIVIRNAFDLRVRGEEIEALIQSYGMRIRLRDAGEGNPRSRDEIMNNAHARLGHDRQFEMLEMVIVLMN